jgi:hypothetical protein
MTFVQYFLEQHDLDSLLMSVWLIPCEHEQEPASIWRIFEEPARNRTHTKV